MQELPDDVRPVAQIVGPSTYAQTESEICPVTMVVEAGPETRRVLVEIEAALKRIADHFDPRPPDVVGTPYLANKLGCTATWIAQMVRSGEIPKGCIVPGSGKGRQWRFHRRRIEEWLANR
jgi:hypothetical protein